MIPTLIRNYYEVLGVPRGAKLAAIRRRYLTLVQEGHPDRFSEPAERARKAEEFKWINEAWQVLSDPVQRGNYDSCLNGGTEFRSTTGREKSLEMIFNDAKRFEFNWQSVLPKGLHELIEKSLRDVKEFEMRPLAAFAVSRSTAGRSPLSGLCGVSQSEYLILTNMSLILGVDGASETQKGDTRHKATYTMVSTVALGAIEQIEIGLSFECNENHFTLRLGVPDSAFSGVDFECSGSPFVFLWLADLYDIRTLVSVRPADTAPAELPIVTALIVAVAGVLVAAVVASEWAVLSGVLLASFAIAHGAASARRLDAEGRLVAYTQCLIESAVRHHTN